MRVGSIVKLNRSLNYMFKTSTIGAFKKGATFLILEIERNRGAVGATKLQHVKSGKVYDIDDFFGYWCFLNPEQSFEYDVIGFNELYHIDDYIKAIDLNLNSENRTALLSKQSTDTIQAMLYSVNNARRNLDDLEALLTKLLSEQS